MKTQTVTVVHAADPRETREVEALVIGPLSVYHRVNGDGQECDDWVVGHVATGWRVSQAIESRARAIRIAEALQSLDWNFTSPRSRKVKAMALEVRQRIASTK